MGEGEVKITLGWDREDRDISLLVLVPEATHNTGDTAMVSELVRLETCDLRMALG